MHVEVKGELFGAGSLLSHGFWVELRCPIYTASTFACGAVFPPPHTAVCVDAGDPNSNPHGCAANQAEPSQPQCLGSVIGWL